MPRLVAVALLTLGAQALLGGVVFDRSFGKGGPAPFANSNYMIPASFGKEVGTNLFQSFSQFNLISSESATFTGPSNIQNILSRVTDGNSSSIDGRISSQIQGANLFFLNPAGVMFGPHARLDVSGSFAVSTANYVRMADGGRFNASLGGQDNMLTSAPVSAFGFLNSAPAAVSVTGSTLNVAPGESFSIIAGDIAINGGTITSPASTSAIDPGARVNLIGVSSAGEVQLDATTFARTVDVTQFNAMGDVQLTNSALINTSGGVGGPVFIRAGNLLLTGSSEISSLTFDDTSSPFAPGTVSIKTGSVLIDQRSSIHTDAFNGVPGTIEINANVLQVLNGSVLSAVLHPGVGGGGTIQINANVLQVFNGSVLTTANVSGIGMAGSVLITSKSVSLDGGSRIDTSSDDGSGGPIQICTDALQILNKSVLVTISSTSGIGAGDVQIKAKTILLQGGGMIDSGAGLENPGGNIFVTADSILIDGGKIVSETSRANNKLVNAGTITVVVTGDLQLKNGGVISTSATGGFGDAGSIKVQASDLRLIAGGEISSSTFSDGNGGNVNVIADGSLVIKGARSGIFADARPFVFDGFVLPKGTGSAGGVMVRAGNLTITNGGEISSSTASIGNGGNVDVTARSILIDGAGAFEFSTGILAVAGVGSSGLGGNVGVNAVSLSLQNEGTVSAASFTSAAAGSVHLSLGTLSMNSSSSISSANTGTGAAGSVIIDTTGPMALTGGSNVSTSAFSGNAGDVAVQSTDLTITDGSEISSSTFGRGNGGSVSVFANSLFLDKGNSNLFTGITAEAAGGSSGNAGNVTVQSGGLTIVGGGEISSNTFGQGGGGTVNVMADSVLVDGANSGIFAIARAGSNGIGGDVVVGASALSLQNGGSVSAASFTSSAAGSVHLSLRTLSMNSGSSISSANSGTGTAGSVSIATTGPVKLSEASNISTSAHGGTAGDVTVHTSDLGITQGAEISSSTFGGGSGGNIKIAANSVFIDGTGSAISAEARAGTGNGGEVNITASSLLLENAGTVSAKSLTAAMAGSIRLALGTLTMESDSSISSANGGAGSAGGVFVSASGAVKLRDGTISTSSKLSSAGNIELISHGRLRLSGRSSITASAGTNGGNIHIRASDLLYVTDSSITATAGTGLTKTGKGGTGGNITIDPQFILLKNSLISANAAAGQGGNINLISDFFFNSDSLISATGTTNNGTVSITAPQLDLGAELITLPDSLVGAANQLQERCTALLQGDFSSFISIGRGGTEPEPDELQSEF